MGIIHVMDPHLSNMIAAGEVVDRPVNIVKECVENALDAGASAISVEVYEGGIKGVIITDNGCGMDEEDAELAFARHATSKLNEEADLFNIQTMGFRGEALASIAAVACVDLRTSNQGQGTHIRFEYGEMTEKETVSCPRGTRIEITGLFVRTPARFKYLKRAAYEFSIIAETMNKLAIAHPDVRLQLKHDNRMIFQTSGKGDKKEILFQMFGRETAMNAVPFYGQSDDFEIEGLAVQPKINRANKHFIYITVNDRLIRSYPVTNAVVEAYREYLPPDRYPIVFINIKVDPQLVDVNVHPNKLEVRMSKEEYLGQLIINTLENLFSSSLKTVEIQNLKKKGPVQQKMELQYPSDPPANRTRRNPYRPEMSAWQQSAVRTDHAAHPSGKIYRDKENPGVSNPAGGLAMESIHGSPMLHSTEPDNFKDASQYAKEKQLPAKTMQDEMRNRYAGHIPLKGAHPDQENESFKDRQKTDQTGMQQNRKVTLYESALDRSGIQSDRFQTAAPDQKSENENREAAAEEQSALSYPYPVSHPAPAGNDFFSDLKVIGQLKKSYILCENSEGLVIIDQHAAQERFHFEQLEAAFSRKVEVVQPLMIPVRIQVSAEIISRADEINDMTDYYGLHFEPFSESALILRQEPAWLSGLDKVKFLEDMLAEFKVIGKIDIKNMNRHMIATAACHSSIRFNRTLCKEEMEQVIADLRSCRQPFHCPHGRPTVITLSDYQMRKEFERG